MALYSINPSSSPPLPSVHWITTGSVIQVAALAALAFFVLSYVTPLDVPGFWKGHSILCVALTATLVATSLACFRQGTQSKKLKTFLTALSCVAFLAMSALGLSQLSWQVFLATLLPLAGLGALEYYLAHRKSPPIDTSADSSVVLPPAIPSTDKPAPVAYLPLHDELLTVGPYKPIGHLACEFRAKAQENGVVRSVKKLQQDLLDSIERFPDNTYAMDEHVYEAIHTDSLLTLLNLNRDILTENETQQLLVHYLSSHNKTESVRLFAENLHLMPQLLVDAAFTDSRILQDTLTQVGKRLTLSRENTTVILPQKGIADVLKLQQKFPSENWETIRNYLAYFHRKSLSDPIEETEKVLQ